MVYFGMYMLFGLGVVAWAFSDNECFWVLIVRTDDEVFWFIGSDMHEIGDGALYFGGYGFEFRDDDKERLNELLEERYIKLRGCDVLFAFFYYGHNSGHLFCDVGVFLW
jgi:hypothetical protein